MADPDIQKAGGRGGGGSPRPCNRGRRPQKKVSALSAPVWSKNKRGSGTPGPFPGSVTGLDFVPINNG